MAIQKYFRKIRRWQVIAFAVVVGFVVVHTLIYSPWTNPNPRQVYQIYGAFPYSKGYDLDLRATFVSSNPWCKKTLRTFFLFEAAKVNRSVGVKIDVMRRPGDEYMASIALDHFSPGLCGWKYAGLAYGFRENRLPSERYIALGAVANRINHLVLMCGSIHSDLSNRDFIHCDRVVETDDKTVPSSEVEANFYWEER